MKQSYYLYKSGRLQRKDNTLEIVYKDNTKKSIPIERVDDIYVNTIIYTRVLSEIYKTQLNPTISYLHEPSERRFSLCLDIAEIFKPIIADRLIFSMLNKSQITEKDFDESLNFTYINDDARKNITREIDLRLQTKIKHKKLDREVSYEYLMRLEVYKLIKHLLEDEDREVLKNVAISIENIVEQDKPPKAIDSKICKKCSYFDLCYV